MLIASNGVDALQVAERYNGPIRLLITDVIMPQMSGPELARCLTKVRTNMGVLYMSGYTDDKVGNISESDGGNTLLQKPFYIDDLVRKIQEMLHGKDRHASRVASTDSPRSTIDGPTTKTRPIQEKKEPNASASLSPKRSNDHAAGDD